MSMYALIGGRSVLGSPGPEVFNALYERRGIDGHYLAVFTRRARSCLGGLCALGLRGASVTAPFKVSLMQAMDRVGREAEVAQAINTITVEEDGSLSGDLTDGLGLIAALRERVPFKGARVTVLGSGGLARAAVSALSECGSLLTVCCRQPVKATWARRKSEIRKWDDVGDFDVLINATPCTDLPVSRAQLRGAVVLDAVHGDTPLLQHTRSAGGVAISGRKLWAEQARLQIWRWFGLDVPVGELEKDP